MIKLRRWDWTIENWSLYYQNDLNNMFQIFLENIIDMDNRVIKDKDRQVLYNQFVDFMFKYSSKNKSQFVKYDSAEFFTNLKNE